MESDTETSHQVSVELMLITLISAVQKRCESDSNSTTTDTTLRQVLSHLKRIQAADCQTYTYQLYELLLELTQAIQQSQPSLVAINSALAKYLPVLPEQVMETKKETATTHSLYQLVLQNKAKIPELISARKEELSANCTSTSPKQAIMTDSDLSDLMVLLNVYSKLSFLLMPYENKTLALHVDISALQVKPVSNQTKAALETLFEAVAATIKQHEQPTIKELVRQTDKLMGQAGKTVVPAAQPTTDDELGTKSSQDFK